MRRTAVLLLLPLAAACELELDATREIPPALARRIAQARAAANGAPDDGAKVAELGGLLLEAGRFFEAAETLKQAQTGGVDSAAVNAGLAEAYLELGYFQACADQLRTCFSKNRDEPGCLYVFGSLMDGIDDRQALTEAQRSFSRLLQVAPNFRKAKLAKSALDQIEARLSQLGAAPTPAPPSAPAAAAPVKGGDPHAGVPGAPPAAAAKDPHAGVPGAPAAGKDDEDIGGLNPFGQAIMRAVDAVRKNDAPAAEAAFTEALKIRPDDPAALAGLAESQFAQGKKDQAAATIEKAYAKGPKDPQVRWAFGRIMIDMRKRTDEAVAAWKSLVEDEPEYAKQLGIPARLEAMSKFAE